MTSKGATFEALNHYEIIKGFEWLNSNIIIFMRNDRELYEYIQEHKNHNRESLTKYILCYVVNLQIKYNEKESNRAKCTYKQIADYFKIKGLNFAQYIADLTGLVNKELSEE